MRLGCSGLARDFERELACVHYRHCGHSTSYQRGIIGELYNGRSGTAM
jgi:hypothetical protein